MGRQIGMRVGDKIQRISLSLRAICTDIFAMPKERIQLNLQVRSYKEN